MKWLEWAEDQVGLREAAGAADNPTILQWAKDAGFRDYAHDSIAWCALFVNKAMQAAGIKGTGSLLAQSFRKWGTRLSRPVRGAVFVIPRGSQSWQGHTGIVTHVNANGTFEAVNGNVSDQVKTSTYRTSSVFADGFRWPPGAEMTREAEAAAFGAPADTTIGDRLLKRGATGPDVEELQRDLDTLGLLDNDPEVAVFGPDTEDAVRAFQRNEGLFVDGVVGTSTLPAIKRAVADARQRKTMTKAARTAAAPAAVSAGVAVAGTGVVVDTARSVRDLNDGTVFGLVLALAVIGLLGFFGWKFFIKRGVEKAMGDAE